MDLGQLRGALNQVHLGVCEDRGQLRGVLSGVDLEVCDDGGQLRGALDEVDLGLYQGQEILAGNEVCGCLPSQRW